MRNSTPLIIAATMLLATPAFAQDNAVPATNDAGAAGMTDPLATNGAETAPTNGLTAGPGTTPVAADPAATDPALSDPAYAAPAEERDDGRFPWGLLGLLGLAGLIPRKERPRRHDGAI
jgi:hypothetical protein